MLAAKQAVAKYNDDITAYQNCIKLETDGSIAALDKQGAGKTDEEKKAFEAQKAGARAQVGRDEQCCPG